MPRLRQLPQLYLRGNIVNETTKSLTDQQKNEVDALTQKIANSPVMAGHRAEFMRKLSHTIGGDYRDNPTAAENEYLIAIWRGVVYLKFHTDYTFKCQACNETSYKMTNGRQKAFDRRYPECPACQKVKITSRGNSSFRNGAFTTFDAAQAAILTHGANGPKFCSPIMPIPGKRKVEDPQRVLDDPDQLRMFFGQYCWNYFRQHIRENEIKNHSTTPQRIAGSADVVAVTEITSLFYRRRTRHSYVKRANPIDGYHRILVSLLAAPPALSQEVRSIIDRYAELGVVIEADEIEVRVRAGTSVLTEAVVICPQVVNVQTSAACIGGDGDSEGSVFDILANNIIADDDKTMNVDIERLEKNEVLSNIRDGLSDQARVMFDIISETGAAYDEFVAVDSSHKTNSVHHLARFLGTTTAQVGRLRDEIKHHCELNNLQDCCARG